MTTMPPPPNPSPHSNPPPPPPSILLSSTTHPSEINSICLGSGRFLRSVLVPFLSSSSSASHSNKSNNNNNNNNATAVFQTRGRTFVDSFLDPNNSSTTTTTTTTNNNNNDTANGGIIATIPTIQYPVDTKNYDGSTSTSSITIAAAGTLGNAPAKACFFDSLLPQMIIQPPSKKSGIQVIGIGVTEAGLQDRKNGTMVDLTLLLYRIFELSTAAAAAASNHDDDDDNHHINNGGGGGGGEKEGKICIINTDNVPKNGDLIRQHVMQNAQEFYVDGSMISDGSEHSASSDNKGHDFIYFLQSRVAFLNTMVDRITSARPNSNGLIPLCEPLPMKALVICDEGRDLPEWMRMDEEVQKEFGVKIRHSPKELESDIALKLRVANATHTAVAHVMALSSLINTEALSDNSSTSSSSSTSSPSDSGTPESTSATSTTTSTTAPSPSTTSPSTLLLTYLESLYQNQILPAATADNIPPEETNATWQDWKQRLIHPHFGLSTFFITQNGAAKGGIRLGPSIKSCISGNANANANANANGRIGKQQHPLSVSMAFAMAAILRFLTPVTNVGKSNGPYQSIQSKKQNGIYVGWLDDNDNGNNNTGNNTDGISGKHRETIPTSYSSDISAPGTISYADGLLYNLSEGWYEFRCDCLIHWKPSPNSRLEREMTLPEALSQLVSSLLEGSSVQPRACEEVVRSYLLHPHGGDLQSLLDDGDEVMEGLFDGFVGAVSTMYARMVSGDKCLDLLKEMFANENVYVDGFATSCEALLDGVSSMEQNDMQPLHYRLNPIPDSSNLMKQLVQKNDVRSVLFSEVSNTQVIDLHTHLLPPSHGALCLWGIDELLTYHYLVAEYFMTAPADVIPQDFYAMSKMKQADLIWEALFVQRSPISEATRGVITTLVALGLETHVKTRDLQSIRDFYDSFRKDGLSGAERFCDLVYKVSGVRHAIMTNIPFDSTESQHWRPKKKEYPDTFKSALRVDPLLAGDKETVDAALKSAGYDTTLADARKYLHDWCDTMKPEYMMASTPHDFSLSGSSTLAGVKKSGVNETAMQQPFAFTDITGKECDVGCEETDNLPSIINEDSDFLTQVLMPVCEERDLPLALKIGAHRGVNPELQSAGDGIVAFADTETLSRLCAKFPKVRFLVTFLSRVNQHEACVLANKWRNLHLYGCWWYCNNPSIIKEITAMRVEMLGTAFTSQHSDARVMDQLIYKWSHSRAVIANVLAKEYEKTLNSGWGFTRAEIRRDVQRLLGGSYEEFMAKSLN